MPSQLFKVPTISIDGFSVGQVIITISEFFISVFNVIIYFLTVVEILISLFLESLPCSLVAFFNHKPLSSQLYLD